MRFLRRAEVGLDAKMDLQFSLLEPDAAALGKTRRFRLFRQSQDAGIERPRRFLSVRRHCQLYVFDCVDFHFNYIFLGLFEADCLDVYLSHILYFASEGAQSWKIVRKENI